MKTLQERLIAAAEWHAAQNDYFQDGTLLADAAKRIAELEDSFRWVPTSERMPEPQVSVFVRQSDGKVGVCAWWGDDYKFDVTHWMPLPAPPLPFNAIYRDKTCSITSPSQPSKRHYSTPAVRWQLR